MAVPALVAKPAASPKEVLANRASVGCLGWMQVPALGAKLAASPKEVLANRASVRCTCRGVCHGDILSTEVLDDIGDEIIERCVLLRRCSL
jgi:hypothetical protein